MWFERINELELELESSTFTGLYAYNFVSKYHILLVYYVECVNNMYQTFH